MGFRQAHFCDICKEEFGKKSLYVTRSGPPDEYKIAKITFEGPRYTDAAGSTSSNGFQWEAHEHCWEAFANRVAKEGG